MKRVLTDSSQIQDLQFAKDGLLPAIIQDVRTKEVLMLAYMNRESLLKTLETNETWFFSRSRQTLWHKGETSSHTQHVERIEIDCDADTLLVQVVQQGVACHTGAQTCFSLPDDDEEPSYTPEILLLLEERIAKRDELRPEGAYTTYLFEKGIDKILKKVGEETAEVIIGAKNRNPDEVRYEVADLFYHLLVMLREQRVPVADVFKELAQRYGNGEKEKKDK